MTKELFLDFPDQTSKTSRLVGEAMDCVFYRTGELLSSLKYSENLGPLSRPC